MPRTPWNVTLPSPEKRADGLTAQRSLVGRCVPLTARAGPLVAQLRGRCGPHRGRRVVLLTAGFTALFGVTATAPSPLPQHFTVLALSIVIGFYVIGEVQHALHTPLMSVTNAISGVVFVGAALQVTQDDLPVQLLACVAILPAGINIFGGFAVTRCMLAMFSTAERTTR